MKNKQDMKKMWKDAGILFAITLTVGLVLGFVNELTKEPIAGQEALKIQNSCKEVIADADSFTVLSFADSYPAENEGEFGKVKDRAAENGVKIDDTYFVALDTSGNCMGYIFKLTSTEGYGGNIELMTGILADGSISGVSILSISETPGLGMKAGEVLIPQFAGKKAPSFVYTKSGAAADNEVDAISGATITTKAVTNTVNSAVDLFSSLFAEGKEAAK